PWRRRRPPPPRWRPLPQRTPRRPQGSRLRPPSWPPRRPALQPARRRAARPPSRACEPLPDSPFHSLPFIAEPKASFWCRCPITPSASARTGPIPARSLSSAIPGEVLQQLISLVVGEIGEKGGPNRLPDVASRLVGQAVAAQAHQLGVGNGQGLA